jgi:hypothetical protein
MIHERKKSGFEMIDLNQMSKEIYSLVGKEFPLTISVSHNEVVRITYEDIYENNKLTNNEKQIIEDWISQKLT